MKKIDFTEVSKETLQQLDNGAFMTVKNGEKLNTMTIAWGTIGYMWNRNVFMVLVKEPRYTYELMKDHNEFTVSMPLKGQLKDELIFCGVKSGRDHDKFKELGLTAVCKELDTPIIDECDLHFECKVLYKHAFVKEEIPQHIIDTYYTVQGVHTVIYGEILNTYMK